MTISNRTEWDPRMDAGYIEPTPTCANCCRDPHHLDDVCLVSALLACLRDRGEHTDEQLAQLAVKVNTNYLWNHLGRILDDLGDGKYSTDYEEEAE